MAAPAVTPDLTKGTPVKTPSPEPLILNSDCLTVLRSMPDNSVDAIVTDPPYGLSDVKPEHVTAAITAWATGDRERVPDGRGFMGKAWDKFVPPPAVWDECLRVLKPGGHLLAFAGSGTTVEAAVLEGFNIIGIEREAAYMPLIEARIERARPEAAVDLT